MQHSSTYNLVNFCTGRINSIVKKCWSNISFQTTPLYPSTPPVLMTPWHTVIINVSNEQYQWLAGGYDLEIEHFEKWLA